MPDLLAHFAAARRRQVPDGSEECGCCKGSGLHHRDGSDGQDETRCTRCGQKGYVRQGSRAPYCEDSENRPRRRHWRERTASIRMVHPDEYSRYVYPDYPQRTLPALAQRFRKHPYYPILKEDIEKNGIRNPVLIRRSDSAGRPLKRPRVMEGHHRAAIAYELGIHLPVGDYDDEDDFDAGQEHGQQWFHEHWQDKETELPPWRRHAMADVSDYGIGHRPLSDGAPAHDLHEAYAEDIYTHPQYWAGSWPDKASAEGLSQLRRVRGKPDAMVDIYRATHHSAPHEFNTGDWVSLSKTYAEQHAYAESGSDDPDAQYRIHHVRVPAHQVRDAGTDQYREQGYWGPPIACCGQIKREAAVPQYGPEPEYESPSEDLSDDEKMAHYERQRDIRQDWRRNVRRGLSLGHLTNESALALGYHGTGHDTEPRRGGPGWHSLPHQLYHVTVDEPGVRQHGLRTQEERGTHKGTGLGSSEEDSISTTSDYGIAHGIHRALHEYHHFLNHGDPADLIERARRGDMGSKPFHGALIRQYSSAWKEGDPLPRGLDAVIRGKETKHGIGNAEFEMPGWEPSKHPDSGSWDAPKGRIHLDWERDASPEDHLYDKSQLWKTFSAHRAWNGGPYDPTFMSNDVHRFAKMNPDHFALLHLRPRSGAQGYHLPGEKEWRFTTGDAVGIHHAEHLGDLRKGAALGEERPFMPEPEDHELEAHMRAHHSYPGYMKFGPIEEERKEHDWRHDPTAGPEPADRHQHAISENYVADRWPERALPGVEPWHKRPEEMTKGRDYAQRLLGDEDWDERLPEWKPKPPNPRLSATGAWQPSQRIFGPTYGLDHRLFNEQGELKPEVRVAVLEKMDQAIRVDVQIAGTDQQDALTLYLAGSEASEWTGPDLEGNSDFDVLADIDYDEWRSYGNSNEATMTDDQITSAFNAAMRGAFNDPAWHTSFGTFNLTGYCNGKPIEQIRPYAAWDITHSRWVVKPPHLPAWSADQFPQGPAIFQEARALIAQVRAILRLPEPFRRQEASRIWAYIHEGRKRAFSIEGEGWIDSANVLEKALDQASGHLVDKLKASVYGQETGPMALGQGLTTMEMTRA